MGIKEVLAKQMAAKGKKPMPKGKMPMRGKMPMPPQAQGRPMPPDPRMMKRGM